MSFLYRRIYQGPLRAAILDWAGTVVDHGCMAPAAVFRQAFAANGVEITVAQARAPMGMPKWDHIKAISQMAPVAEAWESVHGRRPTDADVDTVYERFLPLQVETVEHFSDLIPGALDAISAMRARGLKIGSTTGYPRPVMEVTERIAREQGYVPDCVVCAGDTPAGRPGPYPALKALIDMEVSPVEAVVKIGDTVADIEEGLNGGMWTIAVTVTGNEVGLSLDDWNALPADDRDRLRKHAQAKLAAAGAHYVVDSLAEVLPALDDIEACLAIGEKP